MSRLHRIRRRAGRLPSTHDRARRLAADAPRPAARADGRHLARRASRPAALPMRGRRLRSGPDGAACLRDRPPEPPRDLWARTSAAIEREAASRWRLTSGADRAGARPARRPVGDRGHRRRHRCQRHVGRLAHGRTATRGGRPAGRRRARPRTPGPTPIAVGAGSVGWLGTSSTGGARLQRDADRRGLSGRAPARLRRSPTAIRSTSTSRSGRSRSRSRRSATRLSSSGPTPPGAMRSS